MDEESKLKIKQEIKSEHEGKFGAPIEEETTLEVKHKENSEHEGTFENEEDTMERKEVTIPVFDGEDYSMWKKRITMYLKLKKCDVVITRARVMYLKESTALQIVCRNKLEKLRLEKYSGTATFFSD